MKSSTRARDKVNIKEDETLDSSLSLTQCYFKTGSLYIYIRMAKGHAAAC